MASRPDPKAPEGLSPQGFSSGIRIPRTQMLLTTLFHEMPLNEWGRNFVVGDIHAHAALLDHLLTVVTFHPSADRLIALGDLIVRGLDIRWSSCRLSLPIGFKALIPAHPQ